MPTTVIYEFTAEERVLIAQGGHVELATTVDPTSPVTLVVHPPGPPLPTAATSPLSQTRAPAIARPVIDQQTADALRHNAEPPVNPAATTAVQSTTP